MPDSPGGSSETDPTADGLAMADPATRWDRESVVFGLAAWLVSHARASVSPDALPHQFPSSLAPRALRGAPSKGRLTAAEPSATEHFIASSDRSPAHPGQMSDLWSQVVTGGAPDTLAGIAVLLPRTGDPRGLRDTDIIDLAVTAGAALRIEHSDGTVSILVPRSRHEELMTWHLTRDNDPVAADASMSVADAHRSLRAAILDAEGAIGDLGLRAGSSRGRDLVEQATGRLATAPFPRSFDPQRRDLLVRAATIAWMCDLARADESVTVTASDVQARRQALTDLDRIARRALESAVAWSREHEDSSSGADPSHRPRPEGGRWLG